MKTAWAPALAALRELADGNKEAEAILADLEAGKLYDKAYREACEQLLESIAPIHALRDGEQLQFNRAHRSWLVAALDFALPEGHA